MASEKNDLRKLEMVCMILDRLEQDVDDLQTDFINNHIQRLMNNECDPVGGVLFTDMVNDLERCSDHAINIAYALFHNTPEHHNAQA